MNLNSNQNLDQLNEKIADLKELKVLGISYTAIEEIPDNFFDKHEGLKNLSQLYCYGTPLKEPSMTVAAGGVIAIRKYFNNKKIESNQMGDNGGGGGGRSANQS